MDKQVDDTTHRAYRVVIHVIMAMIVVLLLFLKSHRLDELHYPLRVVGPALFCTAFLLGFAAATKSTHS